MSAAAPHGSEPETFYRDQGRGPALLLVHGVGLDHAMWDTHAAALAGDFRVLRPDLAGHGRTPPLGGELSLARLAAQLAALLDRLAIARTALVGFSLGALVAQRFALDYPERLAHLVLLNSVCERSAEQTAAIEQRLALAQAEGNAALAEAALARWFSPQFAAREPGVLAAVRARLLANDPAGFLPAYRVFARADAELSGKARRIAAPTLVMTGELDPGSTPAMSRRLASLIAGAELRIVPGARHMLPVEHAALTVRVLREFLQGRAANQEADE